MFELGDLSAANTMLLIVNDNGTYGFDVLPPFDPSRSKQTVYESGVRNACIVAGVGVPTTVRLARDGATRLLSASINGVLQWVMPDPLGLVIPPSDGNITFFADDAVTNAVETCSGRVNWIRISSKSAD